MGCQCSNEGLVAQRSEADGAVVVWISSIGGRTRWGHAGINARNVSNFGTVLLHSSVPVGHRCTTSLVLTRLCTMELLGQLALGPGVEREGGSHH